MHFAIIAAGAGSRLQQEGVATPKPLVKLHGVPMVDRLMEIFLRCHADSISVIVNEEMTDVRRHLEAWAAPERWVARGCSPDFPFHLVVHTTPSSMHSLAALAAVLPQGRFCLTTVDTVFRDADFLRYVQTFEQLADEEADGCFAVTPYVDDEKPLYVLPSSDGQHVAAFLDTPPVADDLYVSGGIYGLDTRTAFPVLERCMAAGQSRMRNFQRALLDAGLRLRLSVFPKILDVDHAEDVRKAEEFLATSPKRVWAIRRQKEFSPGHVDNDAAILQAVVEHLRAAGHGVEVLEETEFVSRMQTGAWERPDWVVHMARRADTLCRLDELQAAGCRVVNSPDGIRHCARTHLTEAFLAGGIPIPASRCLRTSESLSTAEIGAWPGWLKRGDLHAVQADDVVYVTSPAEAEARRADFARRGIERVVYSAHLRGDLVKFYGVAGTDFFYWFYPLRAGHSKFGLEQHNDPTADIPFSVEELRVTCHRAARLLSLTVYGGDAIIAPDGTFRLIDFNDWPSFAPCRDAAAAVIARMVQ